MKKTFLLAAAATLAFAMPAQAALVASGISGVSNIAGTGNDFQSQLAGLGLTRKATNYSIGVTGAPVLISVYRVGAESALTDWVQVNTTNAYAENNDTWDLNDFLISFTQNSNGALGGTINFLSNGNGLGGGGAALGAGQVAVFLPGNLSGEGGNSYTANDLFFGFNDSGSSDGDYDDFIIRISSSAVPEPQAWLMMICGFGLIGGSMRYGRKALAPTVA